MSFCQQLEQSQKEASDLLEQNRLLQDQLRVALGREQSAREGYVLQVGLPRPSRCTQRFQCKGPRQARNVQNLPERGQLLPNAAPLGSSTTRSKVSVQWAKCIFPPSIIFWGTVTCTSKRFCVCVFFNKIILIVHPFGSQSNPIYFYYKYLILACYF